MKKGGTHKMVNVAVIGYGYWGPNLVRNFFELPDVNVRYVVDSRPERCELVKNRYPSITTTADYNRVLNDQQIDAVVIATPVSTHYALATAALDAGKHVLGEKPLTDNAAHCQLLIQKAKSRKLTLMVDHPFLFSGSVVKIKELIDGGELGDIYYCDSTRINLGVFHHDISVIWDLAVHDLSMINYWLKDCPTAVSATGISHLIGQPENMAYINLYYDSKCFSHIHVNWLAPVKIRQTLLCGSRKMVVYDDLNPDEKIKIYDKGINISEKTEDIHQMLVGYRNGDIHIPRLDTAEPLHKMCTHFIDCIKTGKTPLSSAESALPIIKVMEAADQSLKQRGAAIELERMK